MHSAKETKCLQDAEKGGLSLTDNILRVVHVSYCAKFRSCTPGWAQITDGMLHKSYDYHKVPAPFLQVPAPCCLFIVSKSMCEYSSNNTSYTALCVPARFLQVHVPRCTSSFDMGCAVLCSAVCARLCALGCVRSPMFAMLRALCAVLCGASTATQPRII